MKSKFLNRTYSIRTLCTLVIFLLTVPTTYGQTVPHDNLVFWSSTKKLTIADFGIKTKDQETSPSVGQFVMDYQLGGFDFLAKNFNKKVRNYLIKSASSLDTSLDVSISLRYQQTLFDISEIYTRQFRKSLKENKGKIGSGKPFLDGLNQKAMTDFANRRVLYDKETNYGSIDEKQRDWEQVIQKELTDLHEFSNE